MQHSRMAHLPAQLLTSTDWLMLFSRVISLHSVRHLFNTPARSCWILGKGSRRLPAAFDAAATCDHNGQRQGKRAKHAAVSTSRPTGATAARNRMPCSGAGYRNVELCETRFG